jgi:molybdopterin adenylyltransferase
MSAEVRIGIVTVSDRASRGEYEDLGGPAVVTYLQEVLLTGHAAVSRGRVASDFR